MTFISIGECDKKLIYPLIGGISILVLNIILFFFRDDVELNKHPFMLGINAGFGMSLAIIPFMFFLKNSKNTKREKIMEKKIQNNNLIIKYEKFVILFLCGFLDFLQKILIFIFHNRLTNNSWIFNIYI